MAPTGSQPFPPTYSRTPQPLTARHSEAQKNHPTTLTVTGGTTKCGRWNGKPLQVERQTAAGGHFCAPPATQNSHWCVPALQVAKVFAHLQRYGRPPAAPRPPTYNTTASHLQHFTTPPATGDGIPMAQVRQCLFGDCDGRGQREQASRSRMSCWRRSSREGKRRSSRMRRRKRRRRGRP